MWNFETTLNEIKTDLIKMGKDYGLKIIIAIVLLFIGLKVVKLIVRITEKALNRSKIDLSLVKFLLSFVRLGLKISLVLLIAQYLVGDLTPLLAIGAAAGIGIGMALQGSLANFMGGVLILLTRPFSVGDYISETAFGNMGTVEGIQVLYTTLLTVDNKTVIIPNGQLANNSITNYSREKMRRIDLIFNVDYSENTHTVKETLLEVANEHPNVLKDQEIYTSMYEHKDSGVDFILWVWCESPNYLKTKYDLIEKVKIKFDEKGISIPYPQMDVRVVSEGIQK